MECTGRLYKALKIPRTGVKGGSLLWKLGKNLMMQLFLNANVFNIPLQREFGDSKRVFGERRRNDSYTEEEPEWFSAGPTSQSETIELTGFDDKILEEDHKGRKRTRRRTASLKEGKGKLHKSSACLLVGHIAAYGGDSY